MKPGDPVGTPLVKIWKVGTWVWHVRTKKGPWVVVKDDGGDVVYVDTKPDYPATVGDVRKPGHHHKKVTIDHPHVDHHYRSMLDDKEPAKPQPLLYRIHWERFGKGVGLGLGLVLLGLAFLFFLWLDSGAPL